MTRETHAHLARLVHQGQQIQHETTTLMKSSERKVVGKVGRAAGRELGFPRLLQAVSGMAFDANLHEQRANLERRCDSWIHEVRHFLSQVSVASHRIPIGGESHKLLSRLNNATDAARLETRVRRVINLLQTLSASRLVFNAEIPAYLGAAANEKEQQRRAIIEARLLSLRRAGPGLAHVHLVNRDAVRVRLRAHPDVLETVEAVFEAALRDGPDDKRIALASCRVALEGLGRRVTRQADWREAVKRLADEDVQVSFRKTYSLLSAKGSHGMKKPTAGDVELGIHQTLGCLFWLLSKEGEFQAQAS